MHRIGKWIGIFGLLFIATPLWAKQEVRIGILAYRPKAITQAQWQPLASALNRALPGYSFVVETYDLRLR